MKILSARPARAVSTRSAIANAAEITSTCSALGSPLRRAVGGRGDRVERSLQRLEVCRLPIGAEPISARPAAPRLRCAAVALASRARPASRSERARRSSSSQAATLSRPARTLATRSVGRSASTRRRRRSEAGTSTASREMAVGEVFAGPESDPDSERGLGGNIGNARIAYRCAVGMDGAVDKLERGRDRGVDRIVVAADCPSQALAASRPERRRA